MADDFDKSFHVAKKPGLENAFHVAPKPSGFITPGGPSSVNATPRGDSQITPGEITAGEDDLMPLPSLVPEDSFVQVINAFR